MGDDTKLLFVDQICRVMKLMDLEGRCIKDERFLKVGCGYGGLSE